MATSEAKLNVPTDFSIVEDVALESEVESSTSITVDSTAAQCPEKSQSDADETTPLSDSSKIVENEKSKWRTFCENFPDLSREQWYMHHSFNRYWKHYGQVMSWYKKHLVVSKKLQKRYGSQRPPLLHNQPYVQLYQPYQMHSQYPGNQQQVPGKNHPYSQNQKRSKRREKRNKLRKKSKIAKGKKLDSQPDVDRSEDEHADNRGTSSVTEVTETVESDMDFEITEEMLDFFAHSEKHRKEREAQKKLEEDSIPGKLRLNIDEVKGQEKDRTVEAPKEQPGSRRTVEMKELYGKGAAMIHGMETALQMTYDRNSDIKQPKLWPNMPFKVEFA